MFLKRLSKKTFTKSGNAGIIQINPIIPSLFFCDKRCIRYQVEYQRPISSYKQGDKYG